MDFKEYQKSAKETAIYPKDYSFYQQGALLNTFTLIAEYAEAAKKKIRGDKLTGDMIKQALNESHGTRYHILTHEERLREIASKAALMLDQQEPKKASPIEREILTAVLYPLLGLIGEVGELTNAVYEQDTKRITKEAGDVLWYLSEICSTFGINLDDVAQVNLDKLKARKEQGKIQGSGDDREEKA